MLGDDDDYDRDGENDEGTRGDVEERARRRSPQPSVLVEFYRERNLQKARVLDILAEKRRMKASQ